MAVCDAGPIPRRVATSASPTLAITDWLPAPVELEPDRSEFAIGDVHGHLPQFGALLDAMGRASAGRGHLTLLGDLIDRGPASLGCVRRAAEPAEALGFAGKTLLMGNHEMLMLVALSTRPDASDAQQVWVGNGGTETLSEAGQTVHGLALRREHCRAALLASFGADAFAALAAAGLSRRSGNLVFVHAGIDPSVTMARALDKPRLSLFDDRHPCWIRGPFLNHPGGFEGGRIVVHGHTPEPRVLAAKNRPAPVGWHRLDGARLGLDGGSYATGVVTGAEFRSGRYRVFTAAS